MASMNSNLLMRTKQRLDNYHLPAIFPQQTLPLIIKILDRLDGASADKNNFDTKDNTFEEAAYKQQIKILTHLNNKLNLEIVDHNDVIAGLKGNIYFLTEKILQKNCYSGKQIQMKLNILKNQRETELFQELYQIKYKYNQLMDLIHQDSHFQKRYIKRLLKYKKYEIQEYASSKKKQIIIDQNQDYKERYQLSQNKIRIIENKIFNRQAEILRLQKIVQNECTNKDKIIKKYRNLSDIQMYQLSLQNDRLKHEISKLNKQIRKQKDIKSLKEQSGLESQQKIKTMRSFQTKKHYSYKSPQNKQQQKNELKQKNEQMNKLQKRLKSQYTSKKKYIELQDQDSLNSYLNVPQKKKDQSKNQTICNQTILSTSERYQIKTNNTKKTEKLENQNTNLEKEMKNLLIQNKNLEKQLKQNKKLNEEFKDLLQKKQNLIQQKSRQIANSKKYPNKKAQKNNGDLSKEEKSQFDKSLRIEVQFLRKQIEKIEKQKEKQEKQLDYYKKLNQTKDRSIENLEKIISKIQSRNPQNIHNFNNTTDERLNQQVRNLNNIFQNNDIDIFNLSQSDKNSEKLKVSIPQRNQQNQQSNSPKISADNSLFKDISPLLKTKEKQIKNLLPEGFVTKEIYQSLQRQNENLKLKYTQILVKIQAKKRQLENFVQKNGKQKIETKEIAIQLDQYSQEEVYDKDSLEQSLVEHQNMVQSKKLKQQIENQFELILSKNHNEHLSKETSFGNQPKSNYSAIKNESQNPQKLKQIIQIFKIYLVKIEENNHFLQKQNGRILKKLKIEEEKQKKEVLSHTKEKDSLELLIKQYKKMISDLEYENNQISQQQNDILKQKLNLLKLVEELKTKIKRQSLSAKKQANNYGDMLKSNWEFSQDSVTRNVAQVKDLFLL